MWNVHFVRKMNVGCRLSGRLAIEGKGLFVFFSPPLEDRAVSRVALCVRATQNRPCLQLLIFKAT